MTPRQVENILRGRQRLEEEKVRDRWERHRVEVVMSMMPHLDKSNRKKSVKELYELPWDAEKEVKQLKKGNEPGFDPVSFWKKVDENFTKQNE